MRVVIVAVLLAVAGCSGFTGTGGEPTETVTPVPEPSPVPTYPPGLTDDGVTDAERLTSVHSDRLAEGSYTLVSNRTVRYENGTTWAGFSVRVAVDADRTYHAHARTAGAHGPEFLGRPPASAEYWGDGETYLRKLTNDAGTTYEELEGGATQVATWRYWTRTAAFGDRGGGAYRTVRDVLAGLRWTVRPADDDYRLESDTPASTVFAAADVETPRNVTATAVVGESGVVRSIRLRYEGTAGGEAVVVERTVRYERVGSTTVGPPAWRDRVEEDRE
jgi:hypothetical protein